MSEIVLITTVELPVARYMSSSAATFEKIDNSVESRISYPSGQCVYEKLEKQSPSRFVIVPEFC